MEHIVNVEQMRAELKESGVKQAMNMKEETIIKKHKELSKTDEVEQEPKASFEVNITKADQVFFDNIGLKAEWLASIANQYDFDRFAYVHKFKAFRCYRGNNQVEWVSINDLSLINIKKEITNTLMTFQPLQKDKQIIKLPWRK